MVGGVQLDHSPQHFSQYLCCTSPMHGPGAVIFCRGLKHTQMSSIEPKSCMNTSAVLCHGAKCSKKTRGESFLNYLYYIFPMHGLRAVIFCERLKHNLCECNCIKKLHSLKVLCHNNMKYSCCTHTIHTTVLKCPLYLLFMCQYSFNISTHATITYMKHILCVWKYLQHKS